MSTLPGSGKRSKKTQKTQNTLSPFTARVTGFQSKGTQLPGADLFLEFPAFGSIGCPLQRFFVSGYSQIAPVFPFVVGADKEGQHEGRKARRSERQEHCCA